MPTPNFIDQVDILVRSGNGGAGSVHFRRERLLPKGGPDGGNGGKGGDIIIQGNPHLSTLLHLSYTKHIFAPHGSAGGDNQKTGGNGKDITIEVPLGTLIKRADTGKPLVEITKPGQTHILLKGGRGGMGNTFFKSPTQRAPLFAQPGEKGEELPLLIELKLMADIGLVGAPNAGKSTLLATLSAAKPQIAHYPFTTLTPKLGVVAIEKENAFTVAEIPGLIAGASQGKGLGIQFLKHIEHTKALLFLIASDDPTPMATYNMLRAELKRYNPTLLEKKHTLAFTKTDLLNEKGKEALRKQLPPKTTAHFLSSFTQEGIQTLKYTLKELIASANKG